MVTIGMSDIRKELTVADSAAAEPEDRAGRLLDLIEYGWTIIANAHGGDWDAESDDWRSAALIFRDRYHAELDRHSTSIKEAPAQGLPLPAPKYALSEDLQRIPWQFNEAVSMLREARRTGLTAELAAEIDEGLPAMTDALKLAAQRLASA